MLFIAEIGMNYNGNFGLIHELIKQASLSGANIAKFQLGWRDGKDDINHINDSTLRLIKKVCSYYDIEPMFSIITDKAFTQIKKFSFKRYKIASRTLIDNFPLAEKIISENKETFISLGMWKKKKIPFINKKNVKILWCKSLYPTAPWDIQNFPKEFSKKKYFGLSDHSIGIELALIAISRGAQVIEKHFTLDKSDTTIRDHALSLLPGEFKKMVDLGTAMHKLCSLID